jgi:ketosteroid isomerase-like protein
MSADDASQSDPRTAETLRRIDEIAAAFNRQDVDAIAGYFAPDGKFLFPNGPDPWGRRLVGPEAIRDALAKRFAVIRDMRWESIRRWGNGDMAVSEWVVKGTAENGEKIEYFGCDLWEFENGKIVKKDTYWKIVKKD